MEENIIFQQDKFENFKAYRNMFILWAIITLSMTLFVNWKESFIAIVAFPVIGLILFALSKYKESRIKYILTNDEVILMGGKHKEVIPYKNIIGFTRSVQIPIDIDLLSFMPFYYGRNFCFLLYKVDSEKSGVKIYPSKDFISLLKKKGIKLR